MHTCCIDRRRKTTRIRLMMMCVLMLDRTRKDISQITNPKVQDAQLFSIVIHAFNYFESEVGGDRAKTIKKS